MFKLFDRLNSITLKEKWNIEEEIIKERWSGVFPAARSIESLIVDEDEESSKEVKKELPSEEKEKLKLRKELLNIITEWGMYTTCHGIGNIIRADNFILRIIWLVFLTASFGYCSYQVIMNIMGYFNYEVNISSKVVNEAPALFPTVDFCNLNPYDGFVARDYMATTLREKSIAKDNYTSLRQYIDVATAYLKSNMEKDGGLKIIDLYNYGFFFSQMFISCRFQGKECNESDFYYFHNYLYPKCQEKFLRKPLKNTKD